LKVETTNLEYKLDTGVLTKNAKLGQGGHYGVMWPTFRILGLFLWNGWR